MTMASTGSNDKTVNKVALCSAVFAGFAYVGYSVVRTAFGKKNKRDSDDQEHRLYFRRLSQTTQTDVLLGNLDITGSGKVMLRSITVQERIRELNLRARMFTDTMLAIKGSSKLSYPPRHVVTKSLQASPWSSPRILSPVDVQHIINSRSTENLHLIETDYDLYTSSPVRKRWGRNSFRKKSPFSDNMRNHLIDECHKYEEVAKEAEKLFKNNENEVISRLGILSNRTGINITRYEAKCLTACLYSNDKEVLEKTLMTVGNLGTFEDNQTVIREAGCLVMLKKLINHSKHSIKLACMGALSNLVLNCKNQTALKDIIPKLISMLKNENIQDDLQLSLLLVLSNFAVLSEWHSELQPVILIAYEILDKGNPKAKFQACKLLINLSCNEDMVPNLLAVQAPRRLIYYLDDSLNEDMLLRIVTLLANLTQTVKSLNLDPVLDLPTEDKAASPETMYAAIYGINALDRVKSKLICLMNKHSNEDIRNQCRRIVEALP